MDKLNEKLDKKTFAIGVLSLSALILLVANIVPLNAPAHAAMSIRGRDFQAVTARTNRGGDALYLTDGRRGMMAVFQYDPGKRAVVPIAVRPVADAFAGGAAAQPKGPRR